MTRFSPFAAAFTTRPSPPTRLHLTPAMRRALEGVGNVRGYGWTDGTACEVKR